MTANDIHYTARVDQVTEAEWSELLPRFADASIYQTWSYGAVCWGAKQLSHFVLEKDGQVVAMAQVRIVHLPIVGKGIAYVRWGPLCRLLGEPFDSQVLQEVTVALQREYVGRRGLMLRMIPNVYEGQPLAQPWQASLSPLGFERDPNVDIYRTMLVDLAPSLEDLRKGLHQRWRNYLKNAEKSAYTVVEGDTVELYDRFLVLYRQMMARKQFDTTVDVGEFRTLQQALPPHLKMHVLLCEKEGRTLNALVVSHIGDSAIYLLAATGDEGLKERGAHLLQWRALQWLKARGCRWYDVGGINPDRNPGVFQFKSGLGGQEMRQTGGYRLSPDWVNALIVSCGERLRASLRSLKRRRASAPGSAPS
jgi:lipid II:glycine glycyltransferase (peptidoglycan interpeptide bridge formation enzyme)